MKLKNTWFYNKFRNPSGRIFFLTIKENYFLNTALTLLPSREIIGKKQGENPHILMHKRMFLTQLESTLWRRGGAELFLARTQLTKPQSIHQPHHPTNPLAVPLACIHWAHFHPPFAGCLSTAIWTKMMSHLSSRIFLLTFPHPITFRALDRHILLRARALHPGV